MAEIYLEGFFILSQFSFTSNPLFTVNMDQRIMIMHNDFSMILPLEYELMVTLYSTFVVIVWAFCHLVNCKQYAVRESAFEMNHYLECC